MKNGNRTLFSFDLMILDKEIFDIYIGRYSGAYDGVDLGEYWGITIKVFDKRILNYVS